MQPANEQYERDYTKEQPTVIGVVEVRRRGPRHHTLRAICPVSSNRVHLCPGTFRANWSVGGSFS
jgi:hypothetical protein